MKKTGPLRKTILAIAILSFAAAVFCGGFAVYLGIGSGEPVVAALMASVVFFVGVGIVLWVIARADLPNFSLKD